MSARSLSRQVTRLVVIAALAVPLTGCFGPSRHPVPADLLETAKVPGYDAIRFWGDEKTPAFVETIKAQYRRVQAAAQAGQMPGALDKAEFLSISGGGENGAFAAGVMTGWGESGKRPVFEAVTGVSSGALEAPFVFLGPAYDSELRDVYTKTNPDTLYANRWIFGIFMNALKGTGPLKTLIESHVTEDFLDKIAAQEKIGRRLLAATTNIDAQRPVIWDLTAIAASGRPDRRELFVDVLLASAAIPGVFPPVQIHVVADDGKTYDELHVDGGATAQLIFLPPEVILAHYEQDVFGKHRQRTLYVIRNGLLGPQYAPAEESTLPLARRGVATLVKYQVLSNLRVMARAAADGGTAFRFTAIPPSFLTAVGDKTDEAYAKTLFETGRTVGRGDKWAIDPPATPVMAE